MERKPGEVCCRPHVWGRHPPGCRGWLQSVGRNPGGGNSRVWTWVWTWGASLARGTQIPMHPAGAPAWVHGDPRGSGGVGVKVGPGTHRVHPDPHAPRVGHHAPMDPECIPTQLVGVEMDPDTHRVHPTHGVVHRTGGFLFEGSLLLRPSTGCSVIVPSTPPKARAAALVNPSLRCLQGRQHRVQWYSPKACPRDLLRGCGQH